MWARLLKEDFRERMRSSHSPSPGATAVKLKVGLLKKIAIFFPCKAEWNFAMLCPKRCLILNPFRFQRQSWMKNVPRLINCSHGWGLTELEVLGHRGESECD